MVIKKSLDTNLWLDDNGIPLHGECDITSHDRDISYATFYHGLLHSYNDKPAYIHEKYDGGTYQAWFRYGEYHRENDLPAIITKTHTEYYINGKLHRNNGPAIIKNGAKLWYQNGVQHNENGPAVILDSGFENWVLDGTVLINSDFLTKGKRYPIRRQIQMAMVKWNPKYFLIMDEPILEVQEYILISNPGIISQYQGKLNSGILEKYKHLLKTSDLGIV